MVGFLEMLKALEEGKNVVQTADIPKGIPRRVGLGIVQLAKRSGVPVVPLAIASSRRLVFFRKYCRPSREMRRCPPIVLITGICPLSHHRFTEDSPTVVQVAGENGLLCFAHYSPMYRFSKDYCVSGELVHWDAIYADFLAKVYAGVYTAHNLQNVDYWWLLGQGAVEMGAEPGMPINPAYVDKLKAVTVDDPVLGTVSVYDLIQDRIAEMSDPSLVFDPYDGPVTDRKGNVQVKAGSRMSVLQLTTMEWAVNGIIGPWPGEP